MHEMGTNNSVAGKAVCLLQVLAFDSSGRKTVPPEGERGPEDVRRSKPSDRIRGSSLPLKLGPPVVKAPLQVVPQSIAISHVLELPLFPLWVQVRAGSPG